MASARGLNLVRRFSTSTLRTQLVQPPLAVFGVEGRYATALYSAAVKQKKLETVEKDLKEFKNLLKTDSKLAEFMDNPVLKRQLKRDAIIDVLNKKKSCDLTVNALTLMADNGRFDKLDGLCNAFSKIMSAYRGEVVCEIISAKPLDDATLKEVTSSLQGFLEKGQVIQLQTKVDPSIIGGLIVSIGDKYVDMSFSSRIKTYTSIIQEVV
ncbi:ATP synthase subunit O, mitochondrial [Chamberlinius hualienensis]